MDNITLQIKIQQRINKLSSQDFDNIECWKMAEAFNKAQVEWSRRQIHGTNIKKEGDESTKISIDDLQILISHDVNPLLVKKDRYYEFVLRTDYLGFKRISVKAKHECCENRNMIVYLAENADVDNLLVDVMKNPSFDWAETFCTIGDGKIQVYTNNEFDITDLNLTYYKLPVYVEFAGCTDLLGNVIASDVVCEFKDDIAEILIDQTVGILAGSIESQQLQIAESNVTKNT